MKKTNIKIHKIAYICISQMLVIWVVGQFLVKLEETRFSWFWDSRSSALLIFKDIEMSSVINDNAMVLICVFSLPTYIKWKTHRPRRVPSDLPILRSNKYIIDSSYMILKCQVNSMSGVVSCWTELIQESPRSQSPGWSSPITTDWR